MPSDAYWAVACAFLGMGLAIAVAYSIQQAKAVDDATGAAGRANEAAKRWQEAYNAKSEQLEATRIALVQAQKNDRRDERGRFAKAG